MMSYMIYDIYDERIILNVDILKRNIFYVIFNVWWEYHDQTFLWFISQRDINIFLRLVMPLQEELKNWGTTDIFPRSIK